MRCFAVAVLLALVFTACFDKVGGEGQPCNSHGQCQPGLVCNEYDRCVRPGAEEADGDAGLDDGDGITEDGGADADAATDAGDYSDAEPDASTDGGDEDMCGGCPEQHYCDESEVPPTCKRCEDTSHCGSDCLPCAAGESCTNMNGTFCCFPPCGETNVCELVSCGGEDYVCRAFFTPLRYDWNAVDSNPPHWCRLREADGPILDDLRCQDGENLRYYCPWDGICAAGQCIYNPQVERTHHCGASFGCEGDQQSGHCRMHRKDGQPCVFNYDCESFCCSQDNNPTCLAYDEPQCKIPTTLYWELPTLYTFLAKGESDLHDINQWTFLRNDHGTKCTGDSDCDSGHCRHFTYVGENRCEFADCVNDPEADDIKATYFCPEGNHTQHMTLVTNQTPLPPPDICD
jgi:hypothetical protein